MVDARDDPSQPGSDESDLRIVVMPSARRVRVRVCVWTRRHLLGGHGSFDALIVKHWERLQASLEQGVRNLEGEDFDEARFRTWFERVVRPAIEARILETQQPEHTQEVEDEGKPIDILIRTIRDDDGIELWCDRQNSTLGYLSVPLKIPPDDAE